MMKQLCPRCEQGVIDKARVRINSTVLFVCAECEATWFSLEAIGNEPWVDFGTYLKSIGGRSVWAEVDVMEAD